MEDTISMSGGSVCEIDSGQLKAAQPALWNGQDETFLLRKSNRKYILHVTPRSA